jgi:FlaA1/EpsC-like NDP-sugar epimerase
MSDIANAVKEIYGDKETSIIETGIRPGEKMHETLLGKSSLDYLGSYDDLIKLFNDWR